MNLKAIYTTLLTTALASFLITDMNAQCETWTGKANKDELENTHIFYKDALSAEKYAEAYPLWEKVYKAAPAADGKRASHYYDGRVLISNLYADASEAEQAEMAETFLRLYKEEYECYPKDKRGNDKKGYLLEDQAFEMYYTLNSDSDEVLAILKEAEELSGKELGYIVFYPYADLVVNAYLEDKATADECRRVHALLNEIAKNKMATDKEYGPYYEEELTNANGRFEEVADNIFGCDYHVAKLRPEYDANPNDKATYTRVYNQLKDYGCTASEPLMNEIYAKMKKDNAALVAAKNAEIAAQKQEFLEGNPAYVAIKAYKAKNYDEAITKFNEAINAEADPSKKGEYHFYLASIYGRQKKQYSKAKSHALKAANLNPGSGKPYLLLGDLYAQSARSCGKDAFGQRMVILAAIDKWARAKSVDSDPQVQADASKKMGQYSKHYPAKEDVFMAGKKPGQNYRIGCWIGETTTIRTK